MTCVVVAVLKDAVHVFADSAYVGPTGTLVRSGQKVWIVPNARAAVVTRGSIIHGLLSRALAWRCRSYIQLRKRARLAVCGPWGRALSVFGPFELYIAGIGNGTPKASVIVSHRKHRGVPPWRVIDVPYVATTGPNPGGHPKADPVAFGIRAAQLQRAVLQKLPFWRSPVSIVGGALQHVEIDRRGARSETLGGWSDRLGAKLDPSATFSRSSRSG